MIMSSENKNAEQMERFYTDHYQSVERVRCEDCGALLAYECSGGDPMGLSVNELGKIVVVASDKLQSYRVRLDETPTGERMMGYQCECGNDTRLSKAEADLVPEGKTPQSGLMPHEKAAIAEEIRSNKKYKPNFKQQGNKKFFETFSLERIK